MNVFVAKLKSDSSYDNYISKGYYEEKKSKFYSYIYTVNSEIEAKKIIEEVQKKYKDARHVVYAYKIKSISRFSDDKEPSGTAGKVIYSLIEKNDITNALVIVVRYFGGILLGTGPLSRAYLKASQDAIDNCKIIQYEEWIEISLNVNYSDEGLVRKYITNINAKILKIDHDKGYIFRVSLPKKDKDIFQKWIEK